MTDLSQVTLCCVDCYNYDKAVYAINRTLTQCNFARSVFLTDKNIEINNTETIIIPSIKNRADYCIFLLNKLDDYLNLNTSHVLIIQWDGFVTNSNAWTDEFLEYDYIGSRWYKYPEGQDVGNGGFSLRSKKLVDALKNIPTTGEAEDDFICHTNREILEHTYQIKYAPNHIAEKFGHEVSGPNHNTFGFHGAWHFNYYGIK